MGGEYLPSLAADEAEIVGYSAVNRRSTGTTQPAMLGLAPLDLLSFAMAPAAVMRESHARLGGIVEAGLDMTGAAGKQDRAALDRLIRGFQISRIIRLGADAAHRQEGASLRPVRRQSHG
jgi:hypothetical protein